MKNSGFTLAELLITLGVIGVVAALTFPMVLSKYNEVVYMNKLKRHVAFLERMLQNIQNETGSISDTYALCHSLPVVGENMS